MFTGIIEATGEVRRAEPYGDGLRFTIAAPFADALRVDESVAVNGACMTVVGRDAGTFSFVTVEESLAKTALGALEAGNRVNLERALRLGDRLDGHMVQGHVDTVGVVQRVEVLSASWLFEIAYPEAFAAHLIPTGSVAVDGISLTVARLADDAFTVSIIPHTYHKTTVQAWTVGRRVNVEFDMLGKYALRARALGA